jgi:RNA polymerase sigma-70 factor (ECF subfamily)
MVARAFADPTAFDAIYDAHAVAMYRFCLSHLRDRELAEDAVSIVFTKAYRHLRDFRGGSLRAWLVAIARNVVIDEVRRRRPESPIDDHLELVDSRPSPEESALAGETARLVQSMLATLSEDQRRVVELRLSGMKGEEIARALGKRVDAVNALQYRAMERLRGAFGQSLPAEGGRP